MQRCVQIIAVKVWSQKGPGRRNTATDNEKKRLKGRASVGITLAACG